MTPLIRSRIGSASGCFVKINEMYGLSLLDELHKATYRPEDNLVPIALQLNNKEILPKLQPCIQSSQQTFSLSA